MSDSNDTAEAGDDPVYELGIVNIEISPDIAWSILALRDRYYFGAYEKAEIAGYESEEYQIRDAIDSLAAEIESKMSIEFRNELSKLGGTG